MSTTPLASGRVLAGYRIEEEIGRGGMGVVYRATDLSLGRPLALKVIATELAEDEGFRKRFLRESRVAASLGHPHVLPVHAAGEADGRFYLAMHYVEGEDLKTLVEREQRLEPERAFEICGQVAEALDAAHRKGLVHRDVKPGNVLLDGSGQAYLTDFGLSKQVGGASTQTGQLVGTLDYLAPEQIRGERVDGRADEYALACLLYECVAGKPPFRRQSEAEVLWAHMQEAPPRLGNLPRLDPVFARALSKAKEERYPTCTELIESARQALGLETPRVRRSRRLIRRSRWLLAAGALVFAGGIAGLIVALTRAGAPKPIAALPNSAAAIDPRTNRVVAAVPVGDGPGRIVVGPSGVWVINETSQTLSLIDSRTREVVRTFGVGMTPTDLAIDRRGVWVEGFRPAVAAQKLYQPNNTPRRSATTRAVLLVDSVQLAVVKRIKVRVRSKVLPGRSCCASHLTSGFGSLWVASGGLTLSRIDPTTGRVVAVIHDVSTGSGNEGRMIAGAGSVWAADICCNITRVDPASNAGAQVYHGFSFDRINGLAVGDGSLWVSDAANNRVWQIQIFASPRIAGDIPVVLQPHGLAFGDGTLWVANSGDGTVMRIDPDTGKVVATIKVGGAPIGIAVSNDLVWVTVD
jgi:YVTN family beta-propeller protein